jgi:MFS family permease
VRSLIDDFRTFPRAAWILFAGTFVNRFGSFVLPFLVLYLTRAGYSAAQAGVAMGIYGLGHLLASIAGGHLADRIGRRNTIVISMFGSAVTMLTLSQAHTYASIVTITFATGLFSELYRPASYALVADLIAEERRITAYGVYRFAVNLGFAAGPATAGFLADRSFNFLFIGDAATSLIYGLIAVAALPHGMRGYSKDERKGEALRAALADKRFMLMLLATLGITAVDFQSGSTFPLYVKSLGYATSTFGLLLSINGALIVVFELAITTLVRRYRPQPVIALGYFLAGMGFMLNAAARTVPMLALTVVIWTIGEMVSSPVAGAYAAQLAPPQYRGRYMGLMMTTWGLGLVLGPSIGTWVFAHNPAALWIACGVIGTVSALLLLMAGRLR